MRPFQVVGVAFLIGLLVLPGATSWYQLHGGPERSATWLMPDEPLDVTAYRSLLGPEESLTTLLGPNFALTVDGLVTVARNVTDDSCVLVRVAASGGAVDRIPLEGCRAPWFQGYDPTTDVVYVCTIVGFDGPALQARSARDGSLLWAVVPSRDLGVVDAPGGLFWGCSGVAFDFARREAVVPFISARTGLDAWHHRVAAVHLDTGAVRWVTQIPLTGEVTGGMIPVTQPLEGSGFYILPLSATLTANGAVITAIVICPDVVTCDVPPLDQSRQPAPFQTAAAWLNRDGIVQGLSLARRDMQSPTWQQELMTRTAGGAFWASANGNLAVASLGGYIIVINPEAKNWMARADISTVEGPQWGVDSLPAPVWSDTLILAPFYRTVTAFDPAQLEKKWAWAATEPGWLVQDLLVAPNGDVFVLAGQSDRSSRGTYGIQGNSSIVVRIDGASGVEKQRLPLHVETWMTTEPDMMIPGAEQGFSFPRPPVLVPISGGVAVSDLSGNLVEIAVADGRKRPAVEVDDPYPAPGVPFGLRVPGVPGLATQRVLVQWGDGFLDESTAPVADGGFSFRHVFAASQRHHVMVTAVYADGTTGTTTRLIDVGGAPPPHLNPLQRAFARENLDMTFGVLGIVLALMGGLWAGSVRVRRRSRLRREMQKTEAAFAATRDRPSACETALDTRRLEVKQLLGRGKLDEAQTALLERQIDELRRAARVAPLDERFDYLPRGLARRLEAMLADGRVSQFEHDRFLAELDREPMLTKAQKGKVRHLIDTWRIHDAAAER